VGSFGKVWKGVYDGRPVAIKTFYSEDADVIGEINLMERVNNKPHVLRLEGVYLSNDTGEEAQVALVTPFMENGSLYDVLVNTRAPQYR
jgi:serine/threonine protein kinase